MKKQVSIPLADTLPSIEAILSAQGVPNGAEVNSRVMHAAKTAIQIYTDLATPMGVMSEISDTDFGPIYQGIGLNDNPGPIESIYNRAHYLALFAATVGPAIGNKVSELFKGGDFVLGNMLDSAASNGTDLISRVLEENYRISLVKRGMAKPDITVLSYSPGYCGWHVSAQGHLFEKLQPEEIGITLRDSFLMEPLKSISGVLLAGPKEIHQFEAAFSFCSRCKSQPCRARMEAIDA